MQCLGLPGVIIIVPPKEVSKVKCVRIDEQSSITSNRVHLDGSTEVTTQKH